MAIEALERAIARMVAKGFSLDAIYEMWPEHRDLQENPCPFPLLLSLDETSPNHIPGTPCAFQCAGTMVTRQELDQYNVIEMAISGVGLFFALFMVATWGLFAAKGKQKMTFWISVDSLMVSAAIFIAALAEGDPEKVWCKDEVDGFKQEDGISWCALQGFMLIFFGLSLCCWWWCSCFDIFSKLYRRKRNVQHYLKYYHWFSWGLPAINCLILLGGQHFGFEQPRLWCFLDADSPESFEFIFFYGWVGILWLTGTIMMMLVIWSILAQTRRYRRGETGGNYLKKLRLYATPIIFVFVFSVFWAIFFSFRFITVLDDQQLRDSAASWFTCLLGAAAAGVPSPHNTSNGFQGFLDPPQPGQVGCGDTQPGRISPGLLGTATVTISSNSIFVFIIFGLQVENFTLWRDYFRSLCAPKPAVRERNEGSKGSITDAVAERANRAVSTFTELRRSIVKGIYTAFLFLTCQELPKPEQPNRSPRLKFDQPTFNQQAYNNTNYTPRYYLNRQGSNPSLTSGNTSDQQNMGLSTPPNYNFPGANYVPQAQVATTNGGRHESQWSDAYDDPLWGINVEF